MPLSPELIAAIVDAKLSNKGYAQLTSLGTAVGLGTIPAGSVFAILQAEGDDLRWRDDGTSPTTSVGMKLASGLDLWYSGDLTAIEFIEVSGSGKLNVSFYGYQA